MSEGVVRKIQPFTIGTRLSVPPEHKCHNCMDVYSPRCSANKDEVQHNLNGCAPPNTARLQWGTANPELPVRVAEQVDSPDAQEERDGEDRNSTSSRSIRKIAICGSAETIPVSPCDWNTLATPTFGTKHNNSNRDDPNQAPMTVDEDMDKRSNPQLKVDTWFERQLSGQRHRCRVLVRPSQDSEDMSPAQRRDLKDMENSLIQLTRSLDVNLAQDRPECSSLNVDTDQSREKQEKIQQMERKNIPLREPITQTCLRLQTLLKNYHQDLKLALDVSSFYQQADNIIFDLNNKRAHLTGSKDLQSDGHMETRDIESQIMMLAETAWWLSDLHPTLAARLTRKQAEVQESWGLLQEESRNARRQLSTTCIIDLTCGDPCSLAQTSEVQSIMEPCSLTETGGLQTTVEPCSLTQTKTRELQSTVECCSLTQTGEAQSTVEPCSLVKTNKVQSTVEPCSLTQARELQSTVEPCSLTQIREIQSTVEHEAHMIMGKDIKEEQNRLKGFEVMQVLGVHDKSMAGVSEGSPLKDCSQVTWDNTRNSEGSREEHGARERKEQTIYMSRVPERSGPELGILLQDSTTSADKTLSWLKDNIAMSASHQHTATWDRPEGTKRQTSDINKDDVILESTRLGQSKRECAMQAQHQSEMRMQDLLQQMETLWEALRRRQREAPINADGFQSHSLKVDTNQGPVDKQQQNGLKSESRAPLDDGQLCKNLPASLEDCGSGMLTELLNCLERDESNPNDLDWQITTGPASDAGFVANPMEELLGVLEDLSEAVEKRGHALFQSPDIQDLMCQHSTVMLPVNQLLSRCAELSMDILDTEADMAVRCEPENCALEGLQEQQDALEMDYQVIREKAADMERLASRRASPEEAGVLVEDVQTTLQALEELGWSMAENQSRLRECCRLQDFLKTYLAMISWTDETRTYIFSESSADQREATPSELDLRIQQKFEDLDKLAAAGQKLITECPHLADIVKERTDELQSMLGWILVHWRAKKDQLNQQKQNDSMDNTSVPDATVVSTCHAQNLQTRTESKSLLSKHKQGTAEVRLKEPASQPESAHPGQISSVSAPQRGPANLVLEEPRTSVNPLGSSISLVLSFNQHTPTAAQTRASLEQTQPQESVHRVSTYLQVTDGNKAESLKEVPPATAEQMASAPSAPQTSSTTATFIPKVSAVVLPTTVPRAHLTSTSHLKETSRRRKKVTHRHTVAGMVGVDRLERVSAVPAGATLRPNTWPLEDKHGGHAVPSSLVNTELQLYIKNNSVVTIAGVNSSGTSNVPSIQGHCIKPSRNNNGPEKSHYSIPLGSMLSFDLPKNWEHVSHINPKDLPLGNGHLKMNGEFDSPQGEPLNSHGSPCLINQTSVSVVEPTVGLSAEEERGERNSQRVSNLCLPPPEKDFCHNQNRGGAAEHAVKRRDVPSGFTGFSDDAKEECYRPKVTPESHERCTEPTCCHSVTKPEHTCTETSQNHHRCLSVQTKICDLNSHLYHLSPKKTQLTHQTGRVVPEVRGFSPRTEGSSMSRSGRVIICAEEECSVCPGRPLPRRTLGKNASAVDSSLGRGLEAVHPDHWQFEEEEEELEDIWNGAGRERTL